MKSLPLSFWEWVGALDSGERTGLLVMCLVCAVTVVVAFLFMVYRIHKNRLDDSLKRELLDRGMSANEIVAVVRARPTKRAF